MELRLSAEQATELRTLIGAALTELRSEIHHTDSAEFRERLHGRERRLAELQGQLDAAAATSKG